jgi:hypothetical protein
MRTRPHAGPAGAMLLTLLAAALSGCRDRSDGLDREAVSGSVTLDGRPIAGDITFIPKANGPSAGGWIADGTYSLGRSTGPAPGLYRVEILSIQPTGRTIPDRDGPPGGTTEERKNVVPGRYNVDSKLEAEVKKGGPNTFDFRITSAPDRPSPSAKRRR